MGPPLGPLWGLEIVPFQRRCDGYAGRRFVHSVAWRPSAFTGDRGGREPAAEACVAGADRAAQRSGVGCNGDRGPDGQVEELRAALAGAFHAGRRGRPSRDRTRPSGKTPLAPEQGAGIVRLPHTPPPRGATRWTLRAMAKAAGVAASTVWTIRQAHGLAPHRWRQFELSNDPAFVETLTGIVGLHVAPPTHAAVLSIDGKPQIQALDRTRPSLPLKTGRGAAMTHDYKRHGDTTPFAALNVLDGAVSASMTPAIAARSFSSASTGSSARSPPARRSMPSSTTTPPTNTARSAPGSRSLRAGLFTSPRPRVRG